MVPAYLHPEVHYFQFGFGTITILYILWPDILHTQGQSLVKIIYVEFHVVTKRRSYTLNHIFVGDNYAIIKYLTLVYEAVGERLHCFVEKNKYIAQFFL